MDILHRAFETRQFVESRHRLPLPGRSEALRPPSPLKTAQASFPTYGSSPP